MLLGLHDLGSMVLPSRVWGQLAITASTFAGSLNVTKPNPRERPMETLPKQLNRTYIVTISAHVYSKLLIYFITCFSIFHHHAIDHLAKA